jgi:hypothetical protein
MTSLLLNKKNSMIVYKVNYVEAQDHYGEMYKLPVFSMHQIIFNVV